MDSEEIKKLSLIEERISKIAQEEGLKTTNVSFEIVPIQRMLEGMSYGFPINFSFWAFGRDYDKYRTIFEHTGVGIPYEQVWNLERPRAFIVETNPFVLKVTTMAHVFGHIDFFLANRFLKHGRSFTDIAEEARAAAIRFKEYEVRYGKDELERTIEAGMSLRWQLHPDPFSDEDLDNESALAQILAIETENLRHAKNNAMREAIEDKIKKIKKRVPPRPVYDVLGYLIKHSSVLEPWQRDVLGIIRNQAKSLDPIRRTKMLNEGWAAYWHERIMRRLFREKLLCDEDHILFSTFHGKLLESHRMSFNWYRNGLALFHDIEERWNKGRFGKEYDQCSDALEKAYWDTKPNKGKEKIFQVRELYSDRMAIEEFFTPDFIQAMELFIYEEETNPSRQEIIYKIKERNPEVIRQILRHSMSLYGTPLIVVADSNVEKKGELSLWHKYYGVELDDEYLRGTLEYLHYLWGNRVYLQTTVKGKSRQYSYDGREHKPKQN